MFLLTKLKLIFNNWEISQTLYEFYFNVFSKLFLKSGHKVIVLNFDSLKFAQNLKYLSFTEKKRKKK